MLRTGQVGQDEFIPPNSLDKGECSVEGERGPHFGQIVGLCLALHGTRGASRSQ